MSHSKKGQNRIRVQGLISPHLHEKIKKYIDSGEFPSTSELVNQALIDFVRELEPKKDQEGMGDIQVCGHISQKYWKKILKMFEDGDYDSISEIVTKAVIRSVDLYQEPDEEYKDESDRLKKEALRKIKKKGINEMLEEKAIEEDESRLERAEAEAERAYNEREERKDKGDSIRRLMRKGLTKAQAKELDENVEVAREAGDISQETAEAIIKEGKFMDYATIKKYEPKKKKKD